MAANKRVRSRRSRTGTEMARESRSAGPKAIRSRQQDLTREIHRLECIIAEAPAKLRQERLRNRDIVPPMDSEGRPKQRRNQRVPLQQKRARSRKVTLMLLELGVVGTGIIALSLWLNQWLGLWG